ncbi:hypothetical protein M9H77_18027 [Catharanthus roseus]|uniref:Uncharacterized protein n=1 Tax=Catharanthus roseus TaxID=4058 RepID=A0ACC0B691_CATRO|nr:hypothetical protein M9H77_18027 [Catharanthus roseus]
MSFFLCYSLEDLLMHSSAKFDPSSYGFGTLNDASLVDPNDVGFEPCTLFDVLHDKSTRKYIEQCDYVLPFLGVFMRNINDLENLSFQFPRPFEDFVENVVTMFDLQDFYTFTYAFLGRSLVIFEYFLHCLYLHYLTLNFVDHTTFEYHRPFKEVLEKELGFLYKYPIIPPSVRANLLTWREELALPIYIPSTFTLQPNDVNMTFIFIFTSPPTPLLDFTPTKLRRRVNNLPPRVGSPTVCNKIYFLEHLYWEDPRVLNLIFIPTLLYYILVIVLEQGLFMETQIPTHHNGGTSGSPHSNLESMRLSCKSFNIWKRHIKYERYPLEENPMKRNENGAKLTKIEPSTIRELT